MTGLEGNKRWAENQRKQGLCVHCNKKARKDKNTCSKHGKTRAIKKKWKQQEAKSNQEVQNKMGEIGDVDDVRCHANMMKRITDKTCRNNCKYFKWDKTKQKRDCQLGYRDIKKYKPKNTEKGNQEVRSNLVKKIFKQKQVQSWKDLK